MKGPDGKYVYRIEGLGYIDERWREGRMDGWMNEQNDGSKNGKKDARRGLKQGGKME